MGHHSPPALARLILAVVLPRHLVDDVCGDLEEEFQLQIQEKPSVASAQYWYWHQVVGASCHYLFTKTRVISAVISLFSIFIFLALYGAVSLLSYGEQAFFIDDFWYNGNVHLLFSEAKFWQAMPDALAYKFSPDLLLDLTAICWSLVAFSLLLKLSNDACLSLFQFCCLAVILMLAPYFYGVISFQVFHLPTNQVGPLIALMWLPILYLIFPVTYLVTNKLKRSLLESYSL
ncbi:hypothetical protein MHM98_14505 [Psychrobium sp. MM17-31]|uniref:hypothetical protein n=1 Tax=Psychrobium sp. MM17-31 TaxID=2917758 RepID=UPI001EF62EFC|nr:hypothetical protein [Psychrobium sp. MM17-31]MCG7532547.1 hypothetical protein [Psychrobium sp. MM17-31]